MNSIRDLQEQLLTNMESIVPAPMQLAAHELLIVVLKQYRHYKQLSIELYRAATTKTGKLKNPLLPVNPLDAALHAADQQESKFYAAIARFQNNPTAGKSPADIGALRQVIRNVPGLKFYMHNADLSENVVAGALIHVLPGETISDITLVVKREDEFFSVHPQLTHKGRKYHFHDVDVKFDYFIVINRTFHLLAKFELLKICRFAKQHAAGLRIPFAAYGEFQQKVLAKLEPDVNILYTYMRLATKKQLLDTHHGEPPQRLLYLSDLGSYILINPVMKYGNIEIPVLTKRQIYDRDVEGNLFAVNRDDKAELIFTALLLKQHPDFEQQLDYDPKEFYLHKTRFLDEDWFLNAFEQWQDEGITVLGFNQIKGNKINPNKAKITIQVTSGLNWFNTEIDVKFGKKRASLKQLHQSVRNNNKFVALDDGTLGILPAEWLLKFEQYFNAADIQGEQLQTPKSGFLSVKEVYKDEELSAGVKEEVARYEAKLSAFDSLQEVEVPPGFIGKLRHYQLQGLTWLNLLDNFNFGGCLADDMGLGKTIQIIAFILGQRKKTERNTNLVVVPTSLLFNWQAEVNKFAPSMTIVTLYGSNRLKKLNSLHEFEFVLTSYGTLLADINFLKDFEFNYIFLDESQNIKNIESQRYHTVRQLKSRNKICITGTPVENNTLDIYAQLSFACPGLLGSKQSFRDLFSIPIDKFKSSRNLAELQRKITPFILRRTKEQVAEELPDKTEVVFYCPMGEAQRKVYDAYEKEFRDYISGKTEEELKKSSMNVLRGLTRLRQICDSPLLLEDEKLFGDKSSKIESLLEQIVNKSPHHKILVFSQFVTMLDLIKKELDKAGICYEYLTGKTVNREQVVTNFQENESTRVFLISLKAGGTGLNLTGADYVYIVDPWWNPAVENQAIDRSYRIGQKKNVVAVRLICPDTLEEKIMKLQESKKALSDSLVGSRDSFFKSLSKSQWLKLLEGEQEAEV